MAPDTIAPNPTATAAGQDPPAPGSSPRAAIASAYPALIAGAVLVGVSIAVVLWARTRPGFDPYGWLVWGHQTIVGGLDTNAAPSWKPLPYLFTLPYALAGHYQVWLWMFTAVAVSLSGTVFAARIAYRLSDAPPERRWAGLAAGAFAGLALLGIQDYSHYTLSAQSDPMIVALCLGAIDCHLSGRPRWAFAAGTLAALGRPEVWPFLGLYSIWVWRVIPDMRRWVLGGAVVLALLWFGIPAVSSRSAFVAGNNALGSGRALHGNKVFGTVGRFLDLHAVTLEVLALVSLALALWRRDRTMLMLGAGVVFWVLVEIAFALHGWPGLPRYMFEAAAVMVVLAAVLVGRLLADGAGIPRGPSWVGIPIVAVIVAALIPTALSRARVERRDLHAQRVRTELINHLSGTIKRLGGAARVRGCGEPLTRLEDQTVLAWSLGLNVVKIGWKFAPAIHSARPAVLFIPHGRGWAVQALHQHAHACRSLRIG